MGRSELSAMHDAGWQIEINCPQCGGAGVWDLLEDLQRCGFCDSLLWWPKRDGTRDFLVVTNQLTDPEILTDTLATSEAMARQRQFLPQESGRREDAPVDLFSGFAPGPALHEIKNRIRPGIRIRQFHTVYAPYDLCSLVLGFLALGRTPRTARKIFQPLFFTHDEITPAYHPPWDFRDRGLKLSRQVMKPLGPELLARYSFLEPKPLRRDDAALLENWRGRRDLLRGELDPLHHTAVLVKARDWTVYRPYVYVLAEIEAAPRWILLDGQFGTVAAYPDSAEVTRVQKGKWHGLAPEFVGRQRLRILPSRCPECGGEVPAAGRTEYLVCRRCLRLLRPSSAGLERIRYGVVADALLPAPDEQRIGRSAVYLPFWRCEGRLGHEGRFFHDFAALLAAAQTGVAAPTGTTPSPVAWWVPAFDCWYYRGYAEWAFAFGRWLSGIDPSPVFDNLSLAGYVPERDHVCVPDVHPDLVRTLFPAILPGFGTDQELRRLNPMLLRRGLGQGTVVDRLELVFVPAPLSNGGAAGEKVIGPEGRVAWRPLQTGQWPPGLRRTTRRFDRSRR
ncbi:MAG: hypothetical protein JXQ27_04110 [Acidobacteria bacterium]|nr:hypothetical protein [Acidobacteriota bacterium]